MSRNRQDSVSSLSSTSSYCSSSSESAASLPDLLRGSPPLDPNRLGIDIEAIKKLPKPAYRDPFNRDPVPEPSSSTREPSPMLWYNSPLLNDYGSIHDEEPLSQRLAGSVEDKDVDQEPQNLGNGPTRSRRKSMARKGTEPYPTAGSSRRSGGGAGSSQGASPRRRTKGTKGPPQDSIGSASARVAPGRRTGKPKRGQKSN
ncbi:hypothetical protein PQX77_014498 [Marasmius sp. AFHP31]|nr:hypothetical protein PQX77_014498 [Marasmius sp. AFHP31]